MNGSGCPGKRPCGKGALGAAGAFRRHAVADGAGGAARNVRGAQLAAAAAPSALVATPSAATATIAAVCLFVSALPSALVSLSLTFTVTLLRQRGTEYVISRWRPCCRARRGSPAVVAGVGIPPDAAAIPRRASE